MIELTKEEKLYLIYLSSTSLVWMNNHPFTFAATHNTFSPFERLLGAGLITHDTGRHRFSKLVFYDPKGERSIVITRRGRRTAKRIMADISPIDLVHMYIGWGQEKYALGFIYKLPLRQLPEFLTHESSIIRYGASTRREYLEAGILKKLHILLTYRTISNLWLTARHYRFAFIRLGIISALGVTFWIFGLYRSLWYIIMLLFILSGIYDIINIALINRETCRRRSDAENILFKQLFGRQK